MDSKLLDVIEVISKTIFLRAVILWNENEENPLFQYYCQFILIAYPVRALSFIFTGVII